MAAAKPSQTVGPFFSFGLCLGDRHHLVADDHPGAVEVAGRVFDGAGDPVDDGMVEVWQLDERGAYLERQRRGHGRQVLLHELVLQVDGVRRDYHAPARRDGEADRR